jgi:monoamine oxidase
VGGGLAGLSAALKLKDNGKTFKLLEASDRLGGRTLMRINGQGEGFDCDFGGGYVGASQNYIQYVLRRFHVQTFRQYLPKDHSWLFEFRDGRPLLRLEGDNPLDLPGEVNAQNILGFIDTLSLDLRHYLPEPWKHPQAAEFDAITVRDWMDGERRKWDAQPAGKQDPRIGMSPDTEDAFLSAVRCAFSLEPSEISFFFMLYYAATAGSFAALVDVAGGEGAAEGTRLRFGTKSLVDALRSELVPDVLPDSSVTEIVHSDQGVVVHTARDTWNARKVIVAMSPPASIRIKYSPELKERPGGFDRVELCKAMAGCLGRTIKGFVRFKEAFWRKDPPNLMGFLLSAGPKETCPVSWTLDNVWHAGDRHVQRFKTAPGFAGGNGGVPLVGKGGTTVNRLMTFIVGEAAEHWSGESDDDRAAAVIDHLQKVYKFDDAALHDPVNRTANYIEKDWLSERQYGIPAPAAMMPKGTLTTYGRALRAPIGNLHWAGSETALEWCGYMNGAIESGFRAAGDVLREL